MSSDDQIREPLILDGGLYDVSRLELRNHGEAFPRVQMRSDGTIVTGDGTKAPDDPLLRASEGGGGAGGGASDASEVAFDPEGTGLEATNVQDAIVEVHSTIPDPDSAISDALGEEGAISTAIANAVTAALPVEVFEDVLVFEDASLKGDSAIFTSPHPWILVEYEIESAAGTDYVLDTPIEVPWDHTFTVTGTYNGDTLPESGVPNWWLSDNVYERFGKVTTHVTPQGSVLSHLAEAILDVAFGYPDWQFGDPRDKPIWFDFITSGGKRVPRIHANPGVSVEIAGLDILGFDATFVLDGDDPELSVVEGTPLDETAVPSPRADGDITITCDVYAATYREQVSPITVQRSLTRAGSSTTGYVVFGLIGDDGPWSGSFGVPGGKSFAVRVQCADDETVTGKVTVKGIG